jgi:hypothetical protein
LLIVVRLAVDTRMSFRWCAAEAIGVRPSTLAAADGQAT